MCGLYMRKCERVSMIPVLWHAPERMSYSCCAALNAMFDAYPVEHFTSACLAGHGGAVVVFHGGNQAHDLVADILNAQSASRPWVIFVSVGDENCDFPYDRLQHPNMRLWVQT